MGNDEYHPLSKKGSNLTDSGGIGYAIIDSIDTMLIMGLEKEYNTARNWIANELSFDHEGNFNTFETTIRVLGGLLTAYHLSDDDPIFLEKATELADRMLPAFDTPTGLPFGMVNLQKREGVDDPNYAGLVSTAEASTLQLELKYLSFLTDNDNYWDKAEGVMKAIKAAALPHGLVPIYMRYDFFSSFYNIRFIRLTCFPSAQTGQFLVSEIRLGSRGDSFYEYLLYAFILKVLDVPSYQLLFLFTFRKQFIQTVTLMFFLIFRSLTFVLHKWKRVNQNQFTSRFVLFIVNSSHHTVLIFSRRCTNKPWRASIRISSRRAKHTS